MRRAGLAALAGCVGIGAALAAAPAPPGKVFPLGGPSRLTASSWRTWVLWGVLAAALLLLGWMVRRLVRQLGAQPRPPNP